MPFWQHVIEGATLTSLARGALLILTWQIGRAATQGVWAIWLARTMGPENYGLFSGLAGLATALGALTGLGFGLLMLQATSRGLAAFSSNWTKTLLATGASGVVFASLYVAIAAATTGYPIDVVYLVYIALPEIVCLPTIIIASYAFQAHERMGWAGAMYALGPVGNLLALSILVFVVGGSTLEIYLEWHFWTSIAMVSVALAAVSIVLRPVLGRPSASRSETREAIGYTAMRVVDTGLGSIDKTLVLRLAGSEIAGHYTAAYRLVALIALPVISLAIAVTPRLFRLERSSDMSAKMVRKVLKWGILLGVVSIPVTVASATILPLLFGAAFQPAAAFATILGPFPALLGLCALGCSALIALGRRTSRILIQAGGLLVLVLSMALLVPVYGGQGATYALLLTYFALTLALWWAVLLRINTSSD